MFKLSKLLTQNEIIIQCHNNPDSDSIGSAFAVYSYLKQNNKNVKIIYSGFEEITKGNILLMLEYFNIPIEYVNVKNIGEIKRPELLICVDCQYGEGNVAKIEADNIAIIDHHLEVVDLKNTQIKLSAIHSMLGSCATLVWGLLMQENYDFAANKNVAMALYYGLLSDTNDFAELNHPFDKDMRDNLEGYCDSIKIRALRNCIYSLKELEISAAALLHNIKGQNKRYVVFEADKCDPNILGFISDTGIKIDSVDVCIVYSDRGNGIKLSVRSCIRDVMASEYIKFITKDVGSGGGHKEKAGGYIDKSKIDALDMTITEYIISKTAEYFKSFEVINAAEHKLDISNMRKYVKKPLRIGFVLSTDVFAEGTPIILRTLEGDSKLISSPNTYLMIGIKGEVYAIKSEKFNSSYEIIRRSVDFELSEYSYTPKVKNEITGEVKELLPYMKACVSMGGVPIYADLLSCNTKVFNEWIPDGYMFGGVGDYIAVRCDDLNDVYIIQGDIFKNTYEEI